MPPMRVSSFSKKTMTRAAEIAAESVRAANLPDDPELRRIAEIGIIGSVFNSAVNQATNEDIAAMKG
jgi:hypothetical protein